MKAEKAAGKATFGLPSSMGLSSYQRGMAIMKRCCRTQARRAFNAAAVTACAIIAALIWTTALLSTPLQAEDARLLYFTHSAGYRHEVIPT